MTECEVEGVMQMTQGEMMVWAAVFAAHWRDRGHVTAARFAFNAVDDLRGIPDGNNAALADSTNTTFKVAYRNEAAERLLSAKALECVDQMLGKVS